MPPLVVATGVGGCLGGSLLALWWSFKHRQSGDAAHGNGRAKAKMRIERKLKVCVCGGSGGVGQALSLLMACDPNVGELSVYDLSTALVPPMGVAADLQHIEKKVKVVGYAKPREGRAVNVLGDCLTGCNLVLVSAGEPRKPGQTREEFFKINADIALELVEACAKHCPDAIIGLIVNPTNSVVPAMAELYKKKGRDPMKIVGVTTLDVVRANKFVSEITCADPAEVDVPVVGGHAGVTILPVFSQDRSGAKIPASCIPELDKHLQDAEADVVNAKKGRGSATLSVAFSGARFGKAILAGINGTPTTECAYVKTNILPDLKYFTTKVTFGRDGVEKVHPIGALSLHEEKRLREVKAVLATEIQSGLDFAAGQDLGS